MLQNWFRNLFNKLPWTFYPVDDNTQFIIVTAYTCTQYVRGSLWRCNPMTMVVAAHYMMFIYAWHCTHSTLSLVHTHTHTHTHTECMCVGGEGLVCVSVISRSRVHWMQQQQQHSVSVSVRWYTLVVSVRASVSRARRCFVHRSRPSSVALHALHSYAILTST